MKTSFQFLLLVILGTACTKTNVVDDPPVVTPPATPNSTGKPEGMLYINCVGEFTKINTRDSAVIWTSHTRSLFGSSGNPMTFDSSTFYHGNYSSLDAYSLQTGITRWSFSWLAFNNAISYREPAFKDSLIFLTSPTSEWDHAYLYCLNKRTGTMYWNKQIDAGYVSIPFNTTPMIMDDKVLVLTRDAANHKYLTAFKISDAAQLWTTRVNDSLSLKYSLVNGKIYSTLNQSVVCYNASDGSLNWQTDLQLGPIELTSTFFEQDKLVLVKVSGKDYTIATLNITNGNVTGKSTLTVPTGLQDPAYAPMGCNYSNNTLFVASRHNYDSVSIRAYDLSSLAMKWEKRFAHYYYAASTLLLTNKYLIFPINSSYPNAKSIMYFLDLDGKLITGIPFTANYTGGFVYVENGITYKLGNQYVNR